MTLEDAHLRSELEEQLGFESLLADLSLKFINLPPSDVDGEIAEAQRGVCEFLGLGLSMLWQASTETPAVLTLTNLYRPLGGPPLPERMDAREYFPWCQRQLLANKLVAVSSVEQLPAEAVRDGESWRHYGIKTSLTVPLSVGGGPPFGALSYNIVREEREWPDALVKRLQLAAQIFANALARKRSENRLRFERLLADLSADFVNQPTDQADRLIDGALQTLVEFLGNDRSTLIEFGKDPRQIQVTHSYAVPGCEPFPVGPFAVNRLPWFIGQFRRGKTVFVRSLPEELPPEATKEKDYCLTHGIQSNVAVPLKGGGSVLGAITFAFLRQRCEWPDEILSRLQLIGEVFANVILRRRAEESLRAALAENEQLRQRLTQENQYLREQAVLRFHHGRIIGRSDAITRVLSEAERVAATDAPVLLLGETGTGKELLAQTIHELSGRKGRPMVIVNCASLPATLIESELFGREAGAYTGAASAQVGRFVAADGSTLFLDEVGEFPVELQAKLLRVLQDGRFERLGSPETVTVNVRIIAATNRNLAQAVREGKFRPDLYHRLNVFPIRIPPLCERREDIPPLAWAFVESFGRRMGKSIKSIPRKTMQQLQQYSWPGNVRELSNVIERAMILAGGDTLHVELPAGTQDPTTPQMTLKESEREQILRVLQDTAWRIRGPGGAAEILGIKPTTLEARMAKLGIKRPRKTSNTS